MSARADTVSRVQLTVVDHPIARARLSRMRGERTDNANFRAALRDLERPGLPADLPGAYAVHEGRPTDEAVQLQGDPGRRGAVVRRNVPAFLAGREPVAIPEGSSGRLALADYYRYTYDNLPDWQRFDVPVR